jgi:hypothetical protein
MKQRALLAILICATALTVFPDQPRANAQVLLTYLGYVPGTAGITRQPRNPNPNGGGQFVPFFGSTTTNFCTTSLSGTTDTVGLGCVTSTWGPTPISQTVYSLAYVNISGSSYGNITIVPPLPASVPVPNVNTANPAIAVNAYYYPSIPCPPGQTCSSAAVIDEYDELQGALLDDTFVSVVVPSDPALNASYTSQGNKYGEVDTTKYGVLINAEQPTYVYPPTNPPTPTAEIFDKWVIGPGGNPGANANQLHVGMQTTNYSIAMYHLQCTDGSTWSTSGNISQCVPPNCPKGESWNVEYKQCVPNCPTGEVWDQAVKRCIKFTGGPGPCHMCQKGFYCAVPIIDAECSCRSCLPDGVPRQPLGNKPQ